MSDFLETPAGDFEWGPRSRRLARIRQQLPGLAIGAGLILSIVGLVWLIQG